MKTLWLSCLILYAVGSTHAKGLRGLIPAVSVYDQRNSIPPPPEDDILLQSNGRKFSPPFLNASGKSRFAHGGHFGR